MMQKVSREFYLRENTLQIAKELLGKILVVPSRAGKRVAGKIVETEAYLGADDKAAHSYGNRRTKRTEVMFSEGGHVYIFFVYGMYFQLNFVVGPRDHAHAILIRAIEPVEGIEIMRKRRAVKNDRELTSGPGKLCIALGIDGAFNGADLCKKKIWLEEGAPISGRSIAKGRRIGIDYAEEFVEKPWRFWLKGNEFVSRRS